MGRANGLGAVKGGCEAWTEGPERRRTSHGGWQLGTSTSASVHGGVTVLTESRQRTYKSSGGSRRLGGPAVEDGGDTCRGAGDAYWVCYSWAGLVVWTAKPPVDGFRVWASKPGRRFRGGTWRHVAESQRLHRGEASLWRKHGCSIDRRLSWTIMP
jgi:hypothetical protein